MRQVTQWADLSGLPLKKFYSNALILGARIMAISVPHEFLAELSPEELKHVSESANNAVTSKAVLQIISGAKSRKLLNGSEQPVTPIIVKLPDELFEQFRDQADRIGMEHKKYFSLAFAMGARLSSMNNLLHNSSIR